MSKQKERDEFIARWMEATFNATEGVARPVPDCPRQALGFSQRMADGQRLIRLARASQRYNEILCSVEMSEDEARRQQGLDDARIRKADEICSRYCFTLLTGGDPRGYAFKVIFRPLDLENSPYNTWGGREDGWGVPS